MSKQQANRNGKVEGVAQTEEQEVIPEDVQEEERQPTEEEVQTYRARSLSAATRNLSTSLAESAKSCELLDQQLQLQKVKMTKTIMSQIKKIGELTAENAKLKKELEGAQVEIKKLKEPTPTEVTPSTEVENFASN